MPLLKGSFECTNVTSACGFSPRTIKKMSWLTAPVSISFSAVYWGFMPSIAMSVRQRLQATLEARRSQQRCWRCALGSPRYSYASQQREAKHPQQADTDLLKPSTQPNLAQFSRHEYEVLPNQTTPISGVHRKTVSKNRSKSISLLARTRLQIF